MTDGQPSVSDEEWERFVSEFDKGFRARAQKPAEKKPEKPRPPRRRKGLRRPRNLVLLAVVAVVAGYAVQGWRESRPAPDETAVAPIESKRPTAPPPTEAFPDRPTRERPFAGSPAEAWADGEKGIVLPEAKAVGNVSSEQMAQGLRLVKDFLSAANLDREVLRGGKPDKALALLDPLQKSVLSDLRGALKRPSFEQDPTVMFSRFAPDEVELVGSTVKVRGRMAVKPGSEGEALVHADYNFVYPVAKVRRGGGGRDEVTRTVIRRELEVVIANPARARVTPGKLWITSWDADIANSACDRYDGYLHPEFDSDLEDEPMPSGPTSDPYDRSKTLDERLKERERYGTDSCGAVTRI